MIFLIIGHSVVDKIYEQGRIVTKPGGIFYSVAAFLTQMKASDKLFLCSAIDKEYNELFSEVYDRVDKRYLSVVDLIPQVELILNDEEERKEIYSHLGNNLKLPIDDLNEFDGILINMITGFDISLEQIQQLRKNFRGIIYFDVHTLSRGVNSKLKRDFRQIKDFGKWAECINILQTNESELQTLSSQKDEDKIIQELFCEDIEQVIITRAEKGASVYFRQGGVIKKHDVNAFQTKVVNKVGCGDVFGSVYFYNYIQNKNIISALKKANLYAGISTTYSDINELRKLNKDAAAKSGEK